MTDAFDLGELTEDGRNQRRYASVEQFSEDARACGRRYTQLPRQQVHSPARGRRDSSGTGDVESSLETVLTERSDVAEKLLQELRVHSVQSYSIPN